MANKWDKYRDELILTFTQGETVKGIPKFLTTHGFDDSRNNRDHLRRYIKKHCSKTNVITKTLDDNNLENKDWKIAWIKDEGISMLVRNNKHSDFIQLDDIRADFKKELMGYAPKFKKFNRVQENNPHLMTIDIADLHIGKLATKAGTNDEYNVEIAVERALEGVKGLLNKAAGFNIDQFQFIIGNDVLHTDTTTRTTTSGTPQDTDGMWYDNFVIAREIYVAVIELLLPIADVHVVHNPSNHDFMSGFMLADTIYSWFHTNPNMTWDVTNTHRKYYQYGNSLIGTSHGDGAKLDKLPLLMAEESKYMWADTVYRFMFLHHLHSKHLYKFKASEDFIGVTIEYMRSLSGTDYWHHKAGYQHALIAVEALLHSRTGGQVARLTHAF